VTFTVNPLSNPLSSVVGTSNVTALDFNVKANQTSDLKVQEMDFYATSSGTYATKNQVAAYYLFKNGVSTPIKSVSGSSISAAGIVTFNGLSETVSANVTNEYYVTVDLNADTDQATKRVQLGLQGYSIIDSDSNNVYDSAHDYGTDGVFDNGSNNTALPMESARKIALVGAGSLWVSMDNTNTNTQKSQIVIAGNTTPYLAAVKMRSTNENVKITDLSVNVASAQDVASMFSNLYITDSSGNILGTTNAVTASTTFSNINLTVPQTTQTYYIKGTLRPIGQYQVGISQASSTFSLYGLTAKGASSNTTLTSATTTATSCASSQQICYVVSTNFHKATSLRSNYVEAVASKISSVDLVTSGGGCSLSSSLTAGLNTVAIIKVTTDNTGSNTLSSGDEVKTVLSAINIDFAKTGLTAPTFTIQKCGGVDTTAVDNGTVTAGTNSSSTVFTFDTTHMPNDRQIPSQTTVYYKVVANVSSVSSTAGNSSLEVDLNNLDTGSSISNFLWYDSSDATTLVKKLLLSSSSIAGVKLTN